MRGNNSKRNGRPNLRTKRRGAGSFRECVVDYINELGIGSGNGQWAMGNGQWAKLYD